MTDDDRRLSRRGMFAAGAAGVGGALAATAVVRTLDDDAAAAGPDPARDFPLASVLPSSYTAGEDDVAEHVRRALEQLEPQGRASILLPPGRHRWNSPCYLAAGTTDLTYELRGHGRGTVLELGPGLREEFAIHLNEDRAGERAVTFPRHPRLRVSDLRVTAASAEDRASLCRTNQASAGVYRVRFDSVRYGVVAEGYTDLMTFRQIEWASPAPDGRMYLMTGVGGDGLVIDQVLAGPDAVVAELVGCMGGTLTACIGGRFLFSDCDAVEMVGAHIEAHGNDTRVVVEPFVEVRSSRVFFRGGWHHVGPEAPAFLIDDADDDRYSEVTWDGYSFAFRPDTPDKERSPDVSVRSVHPNTRLVFRGCTSRIEPTELRSRWPSGPRLASDDEGVRAAIDAAPTAPLTDAQLVRTGAGWTFETATPGGGPAAPEIDRCVPTNTFPGTLPGGAGYRYAVAAYSSFARGAAADGPLSAEARTTTRADGDAIMLDLTLGRPRTGLRVWRGGPGTEGYDAYTDLPVGGATTRLVDSGGFLCGLPWRTGDVPSPPPRA